MLAGKDQVKPREEEANYVDFDDEWDKWRKKTMLPFMFLLKVVLSVKIHFFLCI